MSTHKEVRMKKTLMITSNPKLFFSEIVAITLLIFSVSGIAATTSTVSSLVITDKTQSQYVIVTGDENRKFDEFAVNELQDIIRQTAGADLKSVLADSPEAGMAERRILVGRSKLVRRILGDKELDCLKDQESLVTSRGNDLILVGGGDLGTQYAVYDFVENEAGYRCLASYPGGERFIKTDKLVYSGKESRRIPAFPGYRISFGLSLNRPGLGKFLFRNRGNSLFDLGENSYGPQYRPKFYRILNAQHGLFIYVPPYDVDNTSWLAVKHEGMFKKHPEYFSMKKDGSRADDAQLCFSNPELRKLFTERFIEILKKNGNGVYMVGSNDNQHGRYCWCPGCIELEKKYNSCGGPLWDYILELCSLLKTNYPGVYVTSLAYKGPQQTEKAPDGVVFPENFICDAAFLNSDRSLQEIPAEKLENGEIFQKVENLKKWCKITDHVSFWYYGGQTPCLVYGRAQKELKELRDAGVKSVGACGTGGGVEFGDIALYLYYRLLLDPDIDARAVVKEFAEFKYGAAASMMMDYIDELEKIRVKSLSLPGCLGADDTYEKMGFLTPEQIVKWQDDFDKMHELVKDDPVHSRNVHIARVGVDVWTTVFLPRIKKAFPNLKINTESIIARGLKSCDEVEQALMIEKNRNPARKILNSMSLYAYLKNDSVPEELKQYPEGRIIRYLPVQPPYYFQKNKGLTEDSEAAAKFTMKAKVPVEQIKNGILYQNYDAINKKWIFSGTIPKSEIVPGKYKLYLLKTGYLPQSCRFVLGNLWGTALDMEELGRYFDPSYQKKQYEFWASLKIEGPEFDSASKDKDNYISCDQLFLIDMGMEE